MTGDPLTPGFDQDYWERHWLQTHRNRSAGLDANPYLARETGSLVPGTA